MATRIDARIADLEARLKQLRAEQARVEARRRAIATKRSRQEEARRRTLVGTTVLQRAAADPHLQTQLNSWLNDALVRAEDRALFDLDAPAR